MSEADKFADIVIEDDARDVALWAEISSTDDSGVTVQGIKKGDMVVIESISGICSFSGRSGAKKVLSVVGIVGEVLGSAVTGGAAAAVGKMVKSQAGSIKTELGNSSAEGGGKRRDGYGKDVGGNEFATEEGGIIVCMPSAHGPIYAGKDIHLDGPSKTVGRLAEHVNPRIRNKCFFPCREEGGTMQQRAREDGTLYILAFDSDYSDNIGSYEVRFRVIRETALSSES